MQQLATNFKSGYEVILFENDLEHFYKQGIGIDVAFNNKDHYVPTRYISHIGFNKFQLRNIRYLSKEILDLSESLVKPKLSKKVNNSLEKLQESLGDFLNVANAEEAVTPAPTNVPPKGPLLPDVVSPPPGEEDLPPTPSKNFKNIQM